MLARIREDIFMVHITIWDISTNFTTCRAHKNQVCLITSLLEIICRKQKVSNKYLFLNTITIRLCESHLLKWITFVLIQVVKFFVRIQVKLFCFDVEEIMQATGMYMHEIYSWKQDLKILQYAMINLDQEK